MGRPKKKGVYNIHNYCSNFIRGCRKYINQLAYTRRNEEYKVSNYLYIFSNISNNGNKEVLYIGVTDCFGRRLLQHLKLQNESTKDFIGKDNWTQVCVLDFKNNVLNRMELEYIEYALIQFFKDKCNLTNKAKLNHMNYSEVSEERNYKKM